MPILLPPQLLEIEGADAVAFAHAQFCSDVRALAHGHWHWSAWLTAQGRVRALFRLLRVDDQRLLLALSGGSPDELVAQLVPYVFRSRVRLGALAQIDAVGCVALPELRTLVGVDPAAGMIEQRAGVGAIALPGTNPRGLAFGADLAQGADGTESARNTWRAAEIADGIAELAPATSGRWLPDWLGLRELGAISLDKGCYPGQEIVARMHYRGGNKRCLHRLDFRAAELPGAGAGVGQGEDAGEIVCAAWTGPGSGVALGVLPRLKPGQRLDASPPAQASFTVICAIGDASG